MRDDYDICGSFNNQRFKGIDAERSVNLFLYTDPLAKKRKSMLSTSGCVNSNIAFSGSAATDGFRASYTFVSGKTRGGGTNTFLNNYEFHVIGKNVFRVDYTNTATLIGSLSTSSGYVGISANYFQVTFVDGQAGYVYDTIANTWTQITDSYFPTNPVDTTNADGFTIVLSGGTNTFYESSLNQSLNWGSSGQDDFYASVNGSPTNPNSITLTGGNTAQYPTGTPFTVNLTSAGVGSLPAPLVAGTTYYSIVLNASTLRIAGTFADAEAGNYITITSAPTGPYYLQSTAQAQFASVNSHSGTLVACRTLHRKIFFFSQFFCEVWENSGQGSNQPFRRINSINIEYGTVSAGCIAADFDRIIFLSQSKGGLGPVMEITGTSANPVSTDALDYTLSQANKDFATINTGGLSDANGFLMQENGLIFYHLSFTRYDHSFTYNVSQSTTGERRWHEEEMLGGDRHFAQTHVFKNGKNYCGAYNTNILYEVDPTFPSNDGQLIRRMRIARPIVPKSYERICVNRFPIDVIQGFVEDQGVNEAPTLVLSISKDGGVTYGNKIHSPLGQIGERSFYTCYRKLGKTKRGQAFVPKLEFYSQTPLTILGAAWDYTVEAE